jgi:hypothetical protein
VPRTRYIAPALAACLAIAAASGCGGSSSKSHASATTSTTSTAMATPSRATVKKQLNTHAIETLFNTTGTILKGGVFLIERSRDELHVTSNGVNLAPDFALDHEISFYPLEHEAMVMGELTVLQSEAPRVMARLIARGVHVQALHNHLLGTRPEVMYLHYMETGDPLKIARAIKFALGATTTKFGTPTEPHGSTIDATAVKKAIGHGGEVSVKAGGVVEDDVDRADTVKMDGMPVPAAFNLQFQTIFEPRGHGRASVTGELPLKASEVQPAAKALLSHGIAVTAIHNHELTASPEIFYMHYFASGPAAKLARGVAAAIGQANAKSG